MILCFKRNIFISFFVMLKILLLSTTLSAQAIDTIHVSAQDFNLPDSVITNNYSGGYNPLSDSLFPIAAELTADSILTLHIEALGGIKALEDIKSLHIKMKAEVENLNIEVDIYREPKNKFALIMREGTFVVQKEICDGKHAFRKTMNGLETLEAEELEDYRLINTFNFVLKIKELGYAFTPLYIADINGNNAYKIELQSPNGKIEYWYLSTITNLLIKTEEETETTTGFRKITTLLSDYQPVNGVQYAHFVTQSVGDQTLEFHVIEIDNQSRGFRGVFTME